jgi:hypothetical protein
MRAALLVQLLRCPKSNNGLVWILLTHQFGVTMRATLKKVKKKETKKVVFVGVSGKTFG